MGLGGHLTWTAVAREVRKHYQPSKGEFKCLPIEHNQICKSDLFKDNPNFTFDSNEPHVKLDLSNPEVTYNTTTKDTLTWTINNHITEHVLAFYKIYTKEIKPDLYYSQEEDEKGEELYKRVKFEKYITIDPHSKTSFSPNKEYPFEKWQWIIKQLPKDLGVVQLSVPGKEQLTGDNVISIGCPYKLTGKIIDKSLCYVGPEGGLGHIAAAVNITSILVYTHWIPPHISAYSTTIPIDVTGDPTRRIRKPLPLGSYNECIEWNNKHNPKIVLEEILKLYENNP